MKINLMLPTRKRPDLCHRFCESAEATADSLDNFQITILVDRDDETYDELVEKLKQFKTVVILDRVDVSHIDGFPGLPFYWDIIIGQTRESSDIFGMVGDDMIFRDKGWDSLVIKYFNCIPDKIGCIHFNSGAPQGKNLCINSFVHKRYIEIAGGYVDSRLKGDFSDDYLTTIFRNLNRLTYVNNILLEHCHYDYGKMARDETGIRRRSVDGIHYEGMPLPTFYRKVIMIKIKEVVGKLKEHMQ
jgi:hypothetical protein